MSSTKGPWEDRVRDLIRPQTSFYHKCADRPSAGRARIDFSGITTDGRGFLLEVKMADELVRTPGVQGLWKPYAEKDSSCLSPLQWMEMEQACQKGATQVIVAVGMGMWLWCFDFKEMALLHGREYKWPTEEAYEQFRWTGPKGWRDYKWSWI